MNVEEFLKIKTKREVADFLGIKYSQLFYRVHKVQPERNYVRFEIRKKSGGKRQIIAPTGVIKYAQRRLNNILQLVYRPRKPVHGFIKNKSIISNATPHTKKKYVFNIDLDNFFPSIHLGRVIGAFKAYPFYFNKEVSTFLAQICCFDGNLPQGAPTSPMVSNFICQRLDRDLVRLAKKHRCDFTRYADDITFSTSMDKLSSEIVIVRQVENSGSVVDVGKELEKIITANTFSINKSKTSLKHCYQRQEVTGILVNEFPNLNRKFIRKIRAMLHAWDKFGYEKAENEYFSKYHYSKHKHPDSTRPRFKDILYGKIQYLRMVRKIKYPSSKKENRDKIFDRFIREFRTLNKKPKFDLNIDFSKDIPLILTEGKTDSVYIETALDRHSGLKKYKHRVEVYKFDNIDTLGDQPLYELCKAYSLIDKNRIIICIFDRDNDGLVKKLVKDEKDIKYWGKGVYSLCLPVPDHREITSRISIEHYFSDNEIKTENTMGKRLFLANEFNARSKRHLVDNHLSCQKIPKNPIGIIDSEVFDGDHVDFGLRKSEFADLVRRGEGEFKKFKFEHFKLLFKTVDNILEDYKSKKA